MNSLSNFNEVISYIEDNLTKELNIDTMAKMAQMSVYEFRRVFSFAAGIPISEYIRNRRLSSAAEELTGSQATITELALKYGYDSASSFSRAFKAFHGITPNEVQKNKSTIKMYTRISFDFHTVGGEDIDYRLIEDSEFYISGHSGISDYNDTECCEKVWNDFYETENIHDILNLCGDKIYAAYENGENAVKCSIGARHTEGGTYIPKSKWVCFALRGSDDEAVNAFYKNIIFGWLKSSSYKRNDKIPNLEIFPVDMESDDFLWEIRIPIE